MDGIFYWTSKGLNWDPYGHNAASGSTLPCTADGNGYNTGAPLQSTISSGVRITTSQCRRTHSATLQVAVRQLCRIRPSSRTVPGSAAVPISVRMQRSALSATPAPRAFRHDRESTRFEAGFAFMWHSHNEREITTNNVFPGGMLMMMLVDSGNLSSTSPSNDEEEKCERTI